MKINLRDGAAAHLVAVIQNRNYQMGYREPPSDAVGEILRIAKTNLPEGWRRAPLVLIGYERGELNELLKSKKIPPVLCVGLFYSIRGGTGKEGRASYLYVVWLQSELAPHISGENQAAFAEINWPLE